MIKFIQVEDLLPLRNTILRQGKLMPDECRFPTDKVEGNFHLGYYIKGELVCIASFAPQKYGEFTGNGYQLRGMATAKNYQGQGIGKQLVNFALIYLQGEKANYIWCNARKTAVNFYRHTGFEVVSSEFEVHGIGPHCTMYAKLQ